MQAFCNTHIDFHMEKTGIVVACFLFVILHSVATHFKKFVILVLFGDKIILSGRFIFYILLQSPIVVLTIKFWNLN